MSSRRALGRYAEPAMWVLTALQAGPRHAARLLDDVRSLDGPIGHGTLFAALSRLERLALVEPAPNGAGRRAYRLTQRGLAAAGSTAALHAGTRA
jgi:DNA-binding PadR family transcriptional regulator